MENKIPMMKQVKRILVQQRKTLQSIQCNEAKSSTRDTLFRIVSKEVPLKTKHIRSLGNGGFGDSALQLEEKLAGRYPHSQFDSIERSTKHIRETTRRLNQLNKRFPDCHFQIVKGRNSQLDQIPALDFSQGYNLQWFDVYNGASYELAKWFKKLKKEIAKGSCHRIWQQGSKPILAITVAVSRRGCGTYHNSLKRSLNQLVKKLNNPIDLPKWEAEHSPMVKARNLIFGLHAHCNRLLSPINVHLELVHSELYSGGKTPMVMTVWRIKRGKYRHTNLPKPYNNIGFQVFKLGGRALRKLRVRNSKLPQRSPKADHGKIIKELSQAPLKGYGIEWSKKLVTSTWTPQCTFPEFVEKCEKAASPTSKPQFLFC